VALGPRLAGLGRPQVLQQRQHRRQGNTLLQAKP
jgi:hypothetical protein